MASKRLSVLALFSILAAGGLDAQEKAPAGGLDAALIERLTGARGSMDAAAGVFKVSVPRSDLAVQVGGVRMHPRLGLTSWAAFQQAGQGVMVMGDMVLTEPQVNPVMSVALDNGLEVTALHNHFFGDEPKVMFMHIGGHGSVQELAAAVGKVFGAMKETPPAGPRVEVDPAKTSGAQGAPEGRDRRGGDPQPHDPRGAPDRLPPLLGHGAGGAARAGSQVGPGGAGGGGAAVISGKRRGSAEEAAPRRTAGGGVLPPRGCRDRPLRTATRGTGS